MSPDTAAVISNVDRGAHSGKMKAAYKTRLRMWHPDRFAAGTESERAEASREFIRITTAFEVLSSTPHEGDEDDAQPLAKRPK